MAEGKEYFVRICGASVPVTQEVYQTCHQTKRQVKTLYEKDERHNLVSYDGMDTEDTLGEEIIPDQEAPSVEDIVLDKIRKEKLRLCLPQLTEEEQALIFALFYEERSEQECANTFGISQKGISKRHSKILAKLHKLMKI